MFDKYVLTHDYQKNYDAFGYSRKTIVDVNTHYRTNNYGFRGGQFNKKSKMVALGCSFTFGMGVPEDRIWSSLVAKENGGEYDNLGICGGGIYRIVINFLEYCKIFGNPKKVFALFPDAKRVMFNGQEFVLRADFSNPKYSRVPHDPIDILDKDYAMWSNISAIRVLESFCKISKIDLIWSTWDGELQDYLDQLPDDFFMFYKRINLDMFYNPKTIDSCHKDIESQYLETFSVGGDFEDGEKPHWGVHQHIHIAEEILS